MDRLKSALDGIRAGESLQENTIAYLQQKIAVSGKRRKPPAFLRPALVLACTALLLLSAALVYLPSKAYVDVDVNPSIEIKLNRFGRVVGTHAYNGDGEDVLASLSLLHKPYGEAVLLLLDCMAQKGYLTEDGLISVTLRTDQREEEMLTVLQNGVTDFIGWEHSTVMSDIFPVSGETRSHAHAQDISPAKYLAIQELIELDPSASIEGCKGHSIAEIRSMIREHGGAHHGGTSGADEAGGSGTSSGYESSGGGKGNGHGGHHGNGH